MTKQQIIDYVMDSPSNTNPAILGQFLDEMGSSGSGDFSTCTGTFICDGGTNSDYFSTSVVSVLNNSIKILFVDGYLEEQEINVLLYKGHQTLEIYKNDNSVVSISGGIIEITDGNPAIYDVTGNFTIHYLVQNQT